VAGEGLPAGVAEADEGCRAAEGGAPGLREVFAALAEGGMLRVKTAIRSRKSSVEQAAAELLLEGGWSRRSGGSAGARASPRRGGRSRAPRRRRSAGVGCRGRCRRSRRGRGCRRRLSRAGRSDRRVAPVKAPLGVAEQLGAGELGVDAEIAADDTGQPPGCCFWNGERARIRLAKVVLPVPRSPRRSTGTRRGAHSVEPGEDVGGARGSGSGRDPRAGRRRRRRCAEGRPSGSGGARCRG
jgi:hypothetical protein